jgi:hypothetical protein
VLRENLILVGHLTFVKKVSSEPQPFYRMGLAVDRGKGTESVYYTLELRDRYAEWLERTLAFLKPGRLLMASGVPDFKMYVKDGETRVERILRLATYPELLDRGS